MKLVFIIDNCIYINNFIINTLKRWLTYKIINLINSEYTKIVIIKTSTYKNTLNQQLCKEIEDKVFSNSIINESNEFFNDSIEIDDILVEKKVCKNKIKIKDTEQIKNIEYDLKEENIEKIIKSINDIIFRYRIDKLNSIDILVERINEYYNEYFNKNNDTEIILLSSLKYSEYNQLTNKLDKFFESSIYKKIKLVNIINKNNDENTNYSFYLLFDELILDNRTYKIKEIINSDFINFLDITNSLKKDNINNKCLIQYLEKLQYIETELLLDNKAINNNEYLELLDNICFIGSDNYHLYDKNIINYIKNYINNIKIHILNSKITCIIPKDNIDDEIINSYIKYIIDFYEYIYPKLINNKKANILVINYNELKVKKIKKINYDNYEDISKTMIISNTSMTNWIDEYNEYNPFGILIKYKSSKYSYKGLIDEKSTIFNTYPNIIVSSITNNWISMYDYYELILSYLKTNQEDEYNQEHNQEKVVDTFNINDFNITDIINGDSNIMLPIYINNNHWKLVKNLWTYHISFINNSLETEYNKKMDNIYYLVLLKNVNNLVQNNKQALTYTRIFLFLNILRTTVQVTIDNKYIFNIKKEYVNYYEYITNSEHIRIKLIDYIIRVLQIIISGNIENDKLKSDLLNLRKLLINEWYTYDYNTKNLEDFGDHELDNHLKNECTKYIMNWLELEIDLLKFNSILTEIYKLRGYNQLIKYIDKYNSCIPEDELYENIKLIINNIILSKEYNLEMIIENIDMNDYKK